MPVLTNHSILRVFQSKRSITNRYTEEEFVEIVVNVLDREEGVDKDIALLIADGVYNRLKSSNIRECVRIARLARNDFAQVNRIIDTFAKYGGMTNTV